MKHKIIAEVQRTCHDVIEMTVEGLTEADAKERARLILEQYPDEHTYDESWCTRAKVESRQWFDNEIISIETEEEETA